MFTFKAVAQLRVGGREARSSPMIQAEDFGADFAIEQNWRNYSAEEHAIWRLLFERQQHVLVGRACSEFLDGLGGLGVAADGIPDFRRLNEVLNSATGWQIVAVPGLVEHADAKRTAQHGFQQIGGGAVACKQHPGDRWH